MIRIERACCPDSLKHGRGTRYNKHDIVATLYAMQHGKCCYCEQKIPEEGHGKAVEHFHPKGTFRELKNAWPNLLLACAQCNGKKSDLFPIELTRRSDHPKVLFRGARRGRALLIDPSDPHDEDPEAHIRFEVDDNQEDRGNVAERDSSRRGRATIDITGIFGTYYVHRRREHLDKLLQMYCLLLQAVDAGHVDEARSIRNLLVACGHSRGEFAALSREFARWKRIPERFSAL